MRSNWPPHRRRRQRKLGLSDIGAWEPDPEPVLMHDEGMRRVQVIISGRVQGVGFRYHTSRTADRLGLTGWVRNRFDGAVEAEAEGDEASVDELLTWLRNGPAGARVQNTHVTEMDPTGGSSFDLLF